MTDYDTFSREQLRAYLAAHQADRQAMRYSPLWLLYHAVDAIYRDQPDEVRLYHRLLPVEWQWRNRFNPALAQTGQRKTKRKPKVPHGM